MFRPPLPVTSFFISCLLACSGAAGCTSSTCVPSWALLIKVESAAVPVDAESVMVSFNGGESYECPAVDGAVGTYTCAGNENGTYAVTVLVGGDAETQSTQLDADVCGVIEPEQLDFAFNDGPATAGDAGAN
jgi:hypothetical protein